MAFAPARFDATIPVRVNLYSDTQTRPTPAMRAAMMEAEVGDELDDPRLVFAYDGRTPVECLRAARDDAARWAPR